ncbi:MAG: D-glycero-alpha-D-manno-heptose-1,7-bisphosphate 7-phosphatase [Phycisphaerae bacterium]
MADKAVFLDRDNTIIANDGYLGDPTKVRLLPGAAAAIASMRRLGYRIIVVSNQSGVAKGLFDEAAVEAVNQEMIRQLREQAGAHVDASYYCPYHPDAVVPEYKVDHQWRKPKPGMLKAAAADFDLDLTRCWMVGDMQRDIAAGSAVNCRTILIGDPDHPPQPAPDEPIITPHFIVRSLADAARIIVREQNNLQPHAAAVAAVETGSGLTDLPSPGSASVETPVGAMSAQTVDAVADALAERLRKQISEAIIAPELKSSVDSLTQQMQNAHRHHQMPEFSMSLMLAVLIQGIVFLLLGLAIWDAISYFNIVASRDQYWWLGRIYTLLWAILWLAMGALFQAAVAALYLRHRARQ